MTFDSLHHIFLLRRLPGTTDDAATGVFETELLLKFADFLSAQTVGPGQGNDIPDSAELGIGPSNFVHIQRMFQSWASIQISNSAIELSEELSKLVQSKESGFSLTFYVTEQNATIHLTNEGSRLYFSSFIASQSNESIMSSESDLVAEFPGICVNVPASAVLCSEQFAETLLKFSSTPSSASRKKRQKANNEIDDLRDSVDPILVTQYLTTMLTDRQTRPVDGRKVLRIRKKIRDHIVQDSSAKGKKPFRRSGLWMSIKVVLQFELVNKYGEENGTFLYKLLMLRFMADICREACSYSNDENDLTPDTQHQMTAKIARRLSKLVDLVDNTSANSHGTLSKFAIWSTYYQLVYDEVQSVVNQVQVELQKGWKAAVERGSTTIPALNLENLEACTAHTLKHSEPYLYEHGPADFSQLSVKVPSPPGRTRFYQTAIRDNHNTVLYPVKYLTSTEKNEELVQLVLYDFENYILATPSEFGSATNCRHFVALLDAYLKVTLNYYTEDAVGSSRMILTCLKIIKMLDELVVKTYPLFKAYKTGLNESVMSSLLLAKKYEMVVALELELYFRTRNNEATFPSPIEENEVSSEVFAVKFATQNSDIKKLRQKILHDTKAKINAKRMELQETREYCDALKEKVAGLNCTFVQDRNYNPPVLCHKPSQCKKCGLDSQIKSCTVAVYEKPLPEDKNLQNCIVFELLIPPEIASLRDALFLFMDGICGDENHTEVDNNITVYGTWTSRNSPVHEYCGRRPQTHVTLGSTTMLTTSTLHATGCGRSKVEHVSRPDTSFILNNGFNCRLVTCESQEGYYYPSEVLQFPNPKLSRTIKRLCTMRVEENSYYSGMQWMVNSTTHSQNKVLASQYECPFDLSLTEYKEFGSLRAGHLLQYRNLYRALALQTLSFREKSVLALVCQTIWQAGPPPAQDIEDGGAAFCRDSHQDLVTDPGFTIELVTVLEQFLEKNRKNWSDELVLLTVVLVGNRILSMTNGVQSNAERNSRQLFVDLQTRAAKLLITCRMVALEWMSAIERRFTNASTIKIHSEPQSYSSDERNLRLKLVQISAFGALTYAHLSSDPNVNSILMEGSLRAEILGGVEMSNLSWWLYFIASINDNILLNNTKYESLELFTRNLLRWVRSVGADLEPYFHQQNRSSTSHILSQFAAMKWSGASGQFATEGIWKHYSTTVYEQWYYSQCPDRDQNVAILQMDVVLGKFLVDGKPIGRLPFNITEHSDFQRLFGNLTLVVQTSGSGGHKHITKDTYHGSKYKFEHRPSNSNQLVVTEICQHENGEAIGQEYELVSHKVLKGDIPKLLVDNFSHWKCKQKQCVQFRPKDFVASDFRTKVSFVLDLKTRKLVETSTGRYLLDINSSMYTGISENVMTRLEAHEYMHVFQETEETANPKLSIELPRMDLNFFVSPDGLIFSKEHSGYKVDPQQKFESLIGLQHSLLLTCDNSNPLILVPHGTPNAVMGYRYKDCHHKVEISTETLRKPPCFVFQVDEVLHRLVAQPVQSAWLYLAHLHSLTSGILPDPLTGLTGTESAISLLQSPVCWSCEPMDKEYRVTLESIRALSPIRIYRPKFREEMESITFPEVIPSVCASDAYVFLVDKLLSDSQRMAFAYTEGDRSDTNDRAPSFPATNWKLTKRAYWRSQHIYSPQAQIDPHFMADLDNKCKPNCALVSSLDLDSNPNYLVPTHTYTDANLRAVRLLSDCGNSWRASPHVNPQLLSGAMEDVRVISSPVPHSQYLTGYPDWIQLNVIQGWLGLYNFARAAHATGLQAVWTLMIGAMAFTEDPKTVQGVVEQLKILHSIAVNAHKFLDLDPPPSPAGPYVDTKETSFNRDVLDNMLTRFMKPVPGCIKQASETRNAHQQRKHTVKNEHKRTFKLQKTSLLNYLESTHGDLSDNVFACQIQSAGPTTHFNEIDEANKVIKERLVKWYWNKQLKAFVEKVVAKLISIQTARSRGQGLEAPWPELGTVVDKVKLIWFANRSTYTVGQIWMTNIRCAASGHQSTPNLKCHLTHLRKLIKPIRRHSEDMLSTNSSVPPNKGTAETAQYPLAASSVDQDVNIGTDKILEEYHKDLQESWDQYIQQEQEKNQAHVDDDDEKDEIGLQFQLNVDVAQSVRDQIAALGVEYWFEIIQLIEERDKLKCLRVAGILYRVTPTTILPRLCDGKFPLDLVAHIARAALAWTYEQKVRRCLRFAASGSSMEPKLCRELDTLGYTNWLPDKHPEWVLLQLELDLMIRAVQVEVAESMAKEKGPHSLLQLNMGEGKTSVIIPMLAATLANGTQLCRVTVLKSLYRTNKETLTFSMGGLLGQRVYTFPCQRQLGFAVQNLQTIQELYKECMEQKGVVVTVPEFRLSFQLKLYEICGSSCSDTARQLWKIHNWLQAHVRDVLDECDEILNAKYQLVYTIGKEQQVSGGEDRYIVTQKILKILPQALRQMANEENANDKFIIDNLILETHSFPRCRILDSSCYSRLCQLLANEILDGKSDIVLPQTPPAADKKRVRELLFLMMTEPALTKSDHDDAMRLLDSAKPNALHAVAPVISFLNEKHVVVILTLRGLLAYGALLHCLTRRWRVNYGVSAGRPNRMAVPFRAKDVASERTEFGHIDVAICLTQLSYYYSGLNEDQVRQSFAYLGRETNGELVYQSWIAGTAPDHLPSTLSTLASINLADTDETRNVTIPALRMNMRVIDYWLSKAVYARYSKQFQHKLSCTPWDLCSSEMKLPVTGFSGTNDTKLLLPLTVVPDELPKLMGTNGQVLHNILLRENDEYTALEHGTSSLHLLEKLVRSKIPLLIDVGALIIDLDNEALAREWLKLANSYPANCEESNGISYTRYKAAVYFNDANEITVMDSRGFTTPFKLSPYASNLDVCLIYLDDHHTRGTDLKIPRGTRGAVTLGKGVTKDKLVQGCMRMRLLGVGHTLAFYASQEVDVEIRNTFPSCSEGDRRIRVHHVLLWALNNSSIVIRDGFQHWTLAAANYFTKTGAHSLLMDTQSSALESGPTDDSLRQLAQLCQETEELDIHKLYSPFRKEVLFHHFVDKRLTHQFSAFEDLLGKLAPEADEVISRIMDTFQDGKTKLVTRCRKYTSKVKKFSTLLDEEQERELENELEEVREKQRPGQVQPARSEYSPELVDFITSREWSPNTESPWYFPLTHALKHTNIWEMVQEGCWGTNMCVTEDFCRVVLLEQFNEQAGCDEYLRPVTWMISKTVIGQESLTHSVTHLLLISPYEANRVKPLFTSSATSSTAFGLELGTGGGYGTYLHMFASRMHPNHSTFWLIPSLILPFNSFQLSLNCQNYLHAHLQVFSGSLYFRNMEEQSSYCHLLGLIPEPRTADEEKLHVDGYITGGWLSPVYRNRAAATNGTQLTTLLHPALLNCRFVENPVKLVDAILQARNGGVAPQCSHVFKILYELKKPIMDGPDTALGDRTVDPQPMDLS